MAPSLFSAVGQRLHDQRVGPGHAVLPGCRIRDTAQDSQILEFEQLPAGPASTAAAMRPQPRRFAGLHHEREQIETQLQALAKTTPAAADPP